MKSKHFSLTPVTNICTVCILCRNKTKNLLHIIIKKNYYAITIGLPSLQLQESMIAQALSISLREDIEIILVPALLRLRAQSGGLRLRIRYLISTLVVSVGALVGLPVIRTEIRESGACRLVSPPAPRGFRALRQIRAPSVDGIHDGGLRVNTRAHAVSRRLEGIVEELLRRVVRKCDIRTFLHLDLALRHFLHGGFRVWCRVCRFGRLGGCRCRFGFGFGLRFGFGFGL